MPTAGLALLRRPLARKGHPTGISWSVGSTADLRDMEFYRTTLIYRWGDGPILPWILQNPSVAGTKREFDPTAHRVIRWSYRWGFGGCLLLNLIPYIAPRFADLREWLRWHERGDYGARDALWGNWNRVRDELAPHDAAMVAWGASLSDWRSKNELEAYDFTVMVENAFDTINDPDGDRSAVLKTFCLGTTSGGFPLHPMARGRYRVPDTTAPQPFTGSLGSIVGLGEEVAPV